MDDKRSFVLYTDLREPLEFLSDEDCGRVFRAILAYADLGKAPELSGAAGMAFAFVRSQLDRNDEKWQQTRSRRAEAGRAGARSRAAAASQNEPLREQADNAQQTGQMPDQTDNAKQTEQMLDLLDGAEQTSTNQAVHVPVPVSVPVSVPVPVPVSEPVPVPVSVPVSEPDSVQDGAFARFWSAYPKKVGKKAARQAFARVRISSDELMQALEEQKRSEQWTREGGRYVPNAATWLRGARWEDELPVARSGTLSDAQPRSAGPEPLYTSTVDRLLDMTRRGLFDE